MVQALALRTAATMAFASDKALASESCMSTPQSPATTASASRVTTSALAKMTAFASKMTASV